MRRTALMFVLAGLVGALVATPLAVYASHQFSDVQDSNPFHDDISWLADAEVTLGCGPNVYCPKDNVTREQMAAFMRRLAENRVVDAGSLEGQTLGDITAGGIPGYEIAISTRDIPSSTTAAFGGLVASCPDGKNAIGGGASVLDINGASSNLWEIRQDYPGDDGTTWIGNYNIDNSGGDTLVVTVYAICANVS